MAAGGPRILAWADRVDDALARRRGEDDTWERAGDSGTVAHTWAVLRFAAMLVAAPVAIPALAATVARQTRTSNRRAAGYAEVIARVGAGRPSGYGWDDVQQIDANDRWFVSSDLHRYVRGTFDWPGGQDTKRLYEAVLNHYADHDYGLIEAGDVEDFWMVGGSTYGAAYDMLRTLAAPRRDPGADARRGRIYAGHLDRIVANNRGIYNTINERFHQVGRYRRLIGNHDDVYRNAVVLDALRTIHPGIEVHDFLVLDGPEGAFGVVTHGHHTDAWNGPGMDAVGKIGTWAASVIADLPRIGRDLGVPTAAATTTLLDGLHRSALTTVSSLFGANRQLYSVDEVRLFEGFAARWGADGGPHIILGHTHLPLASPVTPDGARTWSRYLNAGSGVGHGLVTGVEWELGIGGQPEPRLVAWHWADHHVGTPTDAHTVDIDGRAIARRVAAREPSSETLTLQSYPHLSGAP